MSLLKPLDKMVAGRHGVPHIHGCLQNGNHMLHFNHIEVLSETYALYH